MKTHYEVTVDGVLTFGSVAEIGEAFGLPQLLQIVESGTEEPLQRVTLTIRDGQQIHLHIVPITRSEDA